MIPRIVAMLLATTVVATIAYQAWAAQVSPSIQPVVQPIPVNETLGPGDDKNEARPDSDSSGQVITYNCTNGVQMLMSKNLTGYQGEITVIIYTQGGAEVKLRCIPTGGQGPVIQGIREAGIESKPRQETVTTTLAQKTATTLAAQQATTPQEATRGLTADRTTAPAKQVEGQASLQAVPPSSAGERLMLTLLGGILAGLAAVAAWRILLS